MLFPVRCFTCNALLPSDTFDAHRKNGMDTFHSLNATNTRRMCCRRMLLSYPHALESSLLNYPNVNETEAEMFLDIRCLVSNPRDITCD